MADSENFQSCLQTVVDLRSKTANAIKAASDGTHARHGAEMEGKEKKFLSELKLTMDVVNSQIKYEFIFKYYKVLRYEENFLNCRNVVGFIGSSFLKFIVDSCRGGL